MSRLNPADDRLPPMTPQLALRVAVVGSLALLMFAIIFLRLWFLQVLTGNQYVAQAKTNEVRNEAIPAARGEILAADGKVIVDSEKVPAILLAPQSLPVPLTAASTDLVTPPAADAALYARLAPILGMKTSTETCKFSLTEGKKVVKYNVALPEIACLVAQQVSQVAYANVTVATNVPIDVQAYISERSNLFPGVTVNQVSVRKYPEATLAAQLLGTVEPITLAQLQEAKFKGIPETDKVGQTGLEYQYNQYLQGKDGQTRVRVNSFGQFEGYKSPQEPVPGYNLRTSLNLALQRVGQQSLAHSVGLVPASQGGAFIAMDPDNGAIYGMGSVPSYNPTVFTQPLSQKAFDSQFGKNSNDPLLNRAIQGVGPDGSTFKVITATAALQSGAWSAGQTFDDTGQLCLTPGVASSCLTNAGHAAYGSLDMVNAIKVSDDVFFYNLGAKLNVNPVAYPNGGQLQRWARAFGIGRSTGVDLPYESTGTLPTPKRVETEVQAEKDCDNATGSFAYVNKAGTATSSKPLPGYHRAPKHQPGGCGIAYADPSTGEYSTWTIGDNVNTGVGQGDVQVTPLQLAVVYSALANGGKVITPHIGQDIESNNDVVVQKIDPGPVRNLHISAATLSTIQAGLRAAASAGTSADVMGSFNKPVYGKTGTAQYIPTSGPNKGVETDSAWYACFVPASATTRPIVVVVWVQGGGFGDVSAAPVARQILSQWFDSQPGPYKSGSSTDQ